VFAEAGQQPLTPTRSPQGARERSSQLRLLIHSISAIALSAQSDDRMESGCGAVRGGRDGSASGAFVVVQRMADIFARATAR